MLLDNDQSGSEEREKLINSGVLSYDDITVVSCADLSSSELEDTVIVDKYNEYIIQKYNVDLKSMRQFRNPRKEWSKRLMDCFNAAGQPINPSDKSIENDIKTYIANVVVEQGEETFYSNRRGWINSLVMGKRKKLSKTNCIYNN